MIAEKDPCIQSAYNQLQIISQNKQKRLEYEAREKAIRDHNQLMFESREEGMKEGIKEGIKKGMEKGIYGAISICRDLDLPDNVIVEKIQEKYKLSRKVAEDYLQKAQASSIIP